MTSEIENQIRYLADGGSLAPNEFLLRSLDEFGLGYNRSDTGIYLTEPLELLDADLIRQSLSASSQAALAGVDCFFSIDSTNTFMMNRSAEKLHGSICLTEYQTAGRGRRGRQWISPFGKNIYLSLGWCLDQKVSVSGLSLLVGMSLVDSIRRWPVEGVGLKWPNDVLLNGAKMAGILIEVGATADGHFNLVIGMGINIAIKPVHGRNIDQAFTSLGDHLPDHATFSRNQLVSQVLNELIPALEAFQQTGFAPFAGQWSAYDVFRDQEVAVLLQDERIVGRNRGVDTEGNLLLDVAGEVRQFNAGEVSLRATSG